MTLLLRHINLIISSVFDFIYPPLCIVCGNSLSENEEATCELCWSAMTFNEEFCKPDTISSITGQTYFSEYHWCFTIDENILQVIHHFKYYGFKNLKNRLGEFLIKKINSILTSQQIDFIVPVPLHKKRKRSRGYNQSALLCEQVTKELTIPYKANVLKRKKNSKFQTTLSREERVKNVMGIFKAENNEEIKNKNILIIDDVFTTGSTINECSKVLLENGAGRVIALTVIYATIDAGFKKI